MLDIIRKVSLRGSTPSGRRRGEWSNNDEWNGDGEDGGDAAWGIVGTGKVKEAGRGVDNVLESLRVKDE